MKMFCFEFFLDPGTDAEGELWFGGVIIQMLPLEAERLLLREKLKHISYNFVAHFDFLLICYSFMVYLNSLLICYLLSAHLLLLFKILENWNDMSSKWAGS